MKDAKGHGSDPRGGDGAKKVAPNRTRPSFKKRKLDQFGGGSGGGGGGGSGGGQGGGSGGGSMQHPKSGAHTAGIHKALRMNLAQLSAAGTNPAIPKPIIGGKA